MKSTQNFVIDVQAAPGGEAIPSTSVFIELQELVDDANGKILDAEAWAVGTRNGIPVEEGDPAYDNNAKYYAEQADDDAEAAQGAASDAEEYANDAKGHADDALESANNASGYADSAQEDAENASNAAEEAEGYAESAEQSAQEAAQAAVEALWAYLPQDSASGPIANFPDGADNVPVDGLVISAEPIQDLHGYANPWPAGGGKNKFGDYTIVNGYIPASGKITAANDNRTYVFAVKPNTDYAFLINRVIQPGQTLNDDYVVAEFSGDTAPTIGSIGTRLVSSGYVIPSGGSDYTRGSGTFTTASDTKWIAVKLANTAKTDATATAAQTTFEESTTVPTSWTPYSNICPISGRTGGSVTRTGKNVCLRYTQRDSHAGIDYTVTDEGIRVHGTSTAASYSWSGTYTYGTCPIHLPAGTYTFSVTDMIGANQTEAYVAFMGFYSDGTSLGNAAVLNATTTSVTKTFSNPVGLYYGFFVKSGMTVDRVVKIQAEPGSTKTYYEPYSGIVLPITFPTAAGTVYGGSVDVTRGRLVVDRKIINLNDVAWSKNSTYNYYVTTEQLSDAIDANASSDNSLSSGYQYNTITNNNALLGHCLIWKSIRVREADMSLSADDWKALRASENIQFVYRLATPIVYDFDPTELRTLLGTNNVFSDIGDVSVQYRADVQKYIQKLVAQALNA